MAEEKEKTRVTAAEEGSGRPLAYVEAVKSVVNIDGADKIELAVVRAWKVIVGKNSVQPGDRVVFFEIDSVVPRWPCFDPLAKSEYRVKTMKCRGVVSQGFLVSLPHLFAAHPQAGSFSVDWMASPAPLLTWKDGGGKPISFAVGANLTSFIGVTQWFEPEGEEASTGPVKPGQAVFLPFPYGLFPKTDQVRVQNIPELPGEHPELPFEVTEKIDGTSMTVYLAQPGMAALCSRNHRIDLAKSCDYPVVAFLTKNGVFDAVSKSRRKIALQGEFIGPGIGRNMYKLTVHQWRIFDVYLCDEARYALPAERIAVLGELGLDPEKWHVPVIGHSVKIGGKTPDDLVKEADGMSVISKRAKREGLVFKSEVLVEGQTVHFKAVSNSFLLHHGQ